MSFRDIAVTIRCVNRASREFGRIKTDAESMSVSIKNVSKAVMALGATAATVGYLGKMFGILNDQTAAWVIAVGSVISAVGAAISAIRGLAAMTWAHNIALAVNRALQKDYVAILLAVAAAATVAALAVKYLADTQRAAGSRPAETTSSQAMTRRGIYR